jgi:hypothetical protein
MAGTQVSMKRTTSTSATSVVYQIIATCTIKGTLPDTSIFLLQINTAYDAKDDTLLRVVTIADMAESNTNRTLQVNSGLNRWRSNTVTLTYTDLTTANAAWKELNGRINTLVKEVDQYLEEYSTLPEGETVIFPSTDPTTEAALKADYVAASAAVTTAETARDTEAADCNSLQDEITVIQERLTEAQSDLNNYTNIQAQLVACLTSYQTIQPTERSIFNTIGTQVSLSAATSAEKANLQALVTQGNQQNVLFTNNNAALAALRSGPVATAVTTLQARVSTLSSELNTAQTAYNRCVLKTATLQGAVDAARATRDAALAAVRAVCPEFIP